MIPRDANGPISVEQCDVINSIFRYDIMTSFSERGTCACVLGEVKGQSRRHVMYKQQPLMIQRLNNCTSGTLAHVILEMRLLRVARLSNHMPPLLALIIFLTVGRGIFLPLLFKIRLALFPLIFLFLGKTGPSIVAMVLKASSSAWAALLFFLLPPTRILGNFRLLPANAVVLKVRRRLRLFRRRRGCMSASAKALASSATS